MKTTILLVAILFVAICPTLFGQEHDLSMWTRSYGGSTDIMPWYTYMGKKVVVDIRHNYDAVKTTGFCFGKKLGGETISVVPEACGYVGDSNGYGPEVLVIGEKGKVSWFSQNQYVRGVGNPSFAYHWTDVQRKVTKWFSLGFGEQVLKEAGTPTQIDVGPSAKLGFGKVYLQIWPCWGVDPHGSARRGNPTLFTGLGYAW